MAPGRKVALDVGHGHTKSTQSNGLMRVTTWLMGIKDKLHIDTASCMYTDKSCATKCVYVQST